MNDQLHVVISIWQASDGSLQKLRFYHYVAVITVIGYSFYGILRSLPLIIHRSLEVMLALFLVSSAYSMRKNLPIEHATVHQTKIISYGNELLAA